MEVKDYLNLKGRKDLVTKYIANLNKKLLEGTMIGILFGALIGYTLPAILNSKKDNNLEQKTQNEIIIDSSKVDTTNYQNSVDYLDYNKQ